MNLNIREMLPKERDYGRSSGRNGNYSTNYQISGRELMTPDEVRMLDNRYALLFIRGEPPIMEEKYIRMYHLPQTEAQRLMNTAGRNTPSPHFPLRESPQRTFPIWKIQNPITSFFPMRKSKLCFQFKEVLQK